MDRSIEVPVEQFTSKLEKEGVEVHDDGRVAAEARIDGRLNIFGFAVANDDVQYMNGDGDDEDIWQLIIYHGDSGDIYLDGTNSIIILSSQNNDLEPFHELLEWMEWLEMPFSEFLEGEDAEIDPEEIEWERDPDTVQVLSDAPRLTEWEPNTL
ncbi:hypothetical protein OB955_00120 [Halobacteria archaeon AArc-m2/3/4]|uniref:SMI1/KNR4 family protein n=1 Tax=Natronoglomus mannanivorans TaxID=2979990 RepID=A0ABT2Q8C9_9EURY|nr:hypothetical protein [Halobacteria archaeon AArc-m2/3/4]